MAVTCGIFHYLAPGAPCCPCLCILLIFPLLPSLAHTHTHKNTLIPSLAPSLWCYCESGGGELRSVVHPAVWGSVSDSSRLHGLSSPRLWLLHRGHHPPQDQPPQPGRPALLLAGERRVCVCVCECEIGTQYLTRCLYILKSYSVKNTLSGLKFFILIIIMLKNR